MKTRQGFVSNSSSSSFILYGISVRGDYQQSLAEALFDHIGKDAMKEKNNYDSVDDLVDAISDDPWVVESIEGSPVELMYYDDHFLGVNLYISRDTLIKGNYTQGELDEIDAFLAKVSKNKPDVHEGDYYC